MSKRIGMFHVQDNLYVGRRNDGSVRMVKFDVDGGRLPHVCWFHNERAVTEPVDAPLADGEFRSVRVIFDVVLSANAWASIVASVSAGGEDDGRFYEALRMHEQFHSSKGATL